MMQKAIAYFGHHVFRPIIVENKTHLPLKTIIDGFNKINTGNIPSEKLFYKALSRVPNMLADNKQTAMFWTPQGEEKYRNLVNKIKENSVEDGIIEYMIENRFREFVYYNLGFKVSPKLIMEHFSSGDHAFSVFTEGINELKKEKGLKPSLWINTNFNYQEITDVFKVPYNSNFFDKIIVYDHEKYAFVLDQERLDKQKGSLCYIGTDLII